MSELILEKNNLPIGWEMINLGKIINIIKGKKPKNLGTKNSMRNTPYITIKAFERKEIDNFTNNLSQPQCNKKDILIVWDGARSGLTGTGVKGVIGSTLAKLDCYDIEEKYLYYFLKLNFNKINKNPKGIGIPHINPVILNNLEFPVSPKKEQKKIIMKIEKLFADLDLIEQSLEQTQFRLNSLINSILNEIFSGKFLETKQKNNDFKPKNFPLSELLKTPLRNGKSWPPSKSGNGIPILKLTAVTKNDFSEKNIKLCILKDKNFDDLWVKKNDILIERSNSIEYVGIASLYEGKNDCFIFPDLMIRIRVDEKKLIPKFLNYYLRSFNVRRYFQNRAKGSQGSFPKISQQDINELKIPLPTLSKQKEIVSYLESLDSKLNSLKMTHKIATKNLQYLKNSILSFAFEGKLVTQDPNDEPAEILLQKIKLEKQQLIQKQKSSRRRKNVK